MLTVKLATFLLVITVTIVLGYDRSKCGDPPDSCAKGPHEQYYEKMPTSCQPECWGGSCPCFYFVAPSGSYCENGYARLNTTNDCPGKCVPVTSAECLNLKKLGDACRREGICQP